PKFVKRFGELGAAATAAVGAYVSEVRSGAFPAEAHAFHSKTVRLVPDASPAEALDEPAGVVGAPV
ncbi:MAG TPA: 3-methyl-2-oxobutanoate hydroxymethyltransferase, partial [Anaeromyxobacteraceae bacterium]|nr:3-methyl-2-oxobutanoate hydroxymethyltransferase [Anaeromyxobacteraceae bacterium]